MNERIAQSIESREVALEELHDQIMATIREAAKTSNSFESQVVAIEEISKLIAERDAIILELEAYSEI